MNEFGWVAVAAVLILSAARITRLLTIDTFPPVKFFRDKYEKALEDSGWDEIAWCPYCMAPWVTIALGLWGYLTDFQEAWWVINGIIGASYPAAILVKKDGDD